MAPSTLLNRPCRVRIKGVDVDWLAAVLVNESPRQARITEDHPVWRGAVVDTRQAWIRLEKKEK